jgi:hypothetical protein
MRFFACVLCRSPVGRRCVSVLLLAAYAVTAAGVPISLGTRARANRELFPCMASSCGCRTADQCWRSCCCHSLAERLAWAYHRGIQPPRFVLAYARRAGFDLAWLAESSRRGRASDKCCASTKSDVPTTCCQTEDAAISTTSSGTCCDIEQNRQTAAAAGPALIVAWRALACRGHSMTWCAAVPMLIEVTPELDHALPLIARLGPSHSEVADGISSHPAVPPPERA